MWASVQTKAKCDCASGQHLTFVDPPCGGGARTHCETGAAGILLSSSDWLKVVSAQPISAQYSDSGLSVQLIIQPISAQNAACVKSFSWFFQLPGCEFFAGTPGEDSTSSRRAARLYTAQSCRQNQSGSPSMDHGGCTGTSRRSSRCTKVCFCVLSTLVVSQCSL